MNNQDKTTDQELADLRKQLAELEKSSAKRAQLINDLQRALSKVKILSGLLPICSSCKKIRDDKGYWNQIESFISAHSDTTFTHGMCPGCLQELFAAEGLF